MVSALFLETQGFPLPDKGGDGEISFLGKISWHPGGCFGERMIFFALPCPMRHGEKGSCDTPVECGEKSVFEAMVFVRHCFSPDEKVGKLGCVFF